MMCSPRDGREPNRPATTLELVRRALRPRARIAGLRFASIFAINDRLSRFLPAGFYYKTFMAPGWAWERLYEPLIRRAAGLGRLRRQSARMPRPPRRCTSTRTYSWSARARQASAPPRILARADCVCCSSIRTSPWGAARCLMRAGARGVRRRRRPSPALDSVSLPVAYRRDRRLWSRRVRSAPGAGAADRRACGDCASGCTSSAPTLSWPPGRRAPDRLSRERRARASCSPARPSPTSALRVAVGARPALFT